MTDIKTKQNNKIDFDPKLDGPPQEALQATKRSFWQSINNPGYIVAGAATVWSAAERNDNAFHKNLNNIKLYRDLSKRASREAYQAAQTATLEGKDAEAAFKAVEDRYESIKDAFIKRDFNISKGLKGAYERFNLNRPWQKRQFALVIVTVASVAIGAITSYRRERKAYDELHHQIVNRSDDQSPGR